MQYSIPVARIDAENLVLVARALHHGTAFNLHNDFDQETPFEATILGKVVASFLGRVESVGPTSGVVSLVNEGNGESLEAECDLEVLNENGLRRGDEFRCEVWRKAGSTTTRIVRLPPKPVSKERIKEVRGMFKERWNF
jgi:hypothetical protein